MAATSSIICWRRPFPILRLIWWNCVVEEAG